MKANRTHAIPIREARLRLALLKENFEYRKLWDEHRGVSGKEARSFLRLIRDRFGVKFEWGLYVQASMKCSSAELIKNTLDLLSPEGAVDGLPEEFLRGVLPVMFSAPVVKQLISREGRVEHKNAIVLDSVGRLSEALRPFERLLLIDTRARKGQLRRELDELLDCLPLDCTRSRDERERHLEVWKRRRRKEPFRKIAREMSITVEDAKKSFYRAFELTQGKRYAPEDFRREGELIRKSELGNICKGCQDYEKCADPCPDALAYADQDRVKSKERILSPNALEHRLNAESLSRFGLTPPKKTKKKR